MPIELEITLRLLLASAIGAVIGLERELDGHAAGVRTYLLVALGAALFTSMSIHGFDMVDTTRIAAGIVTGIGFLGAGAILREGLSVRGLTTAASLWATAAVGLTLGTGWVAVALAAAALVVVALGPLDWVTERLRLKPRRLMWVRLAGVEDPEAVMSRMRREQMLPVGFQHRNGELEVELRIRRFVDLERFIPELERDGLRVVEARFERPRGGG